MSNIEYILASNGELYHYGVKGMKRGVRKSIISSSKSKPKIFGVIKDEGPRPKTERQKRYEDDNGINPNRPNGTKTSSIEVGNTLVTNLSQKHPKVAKGVDAVTRILTTNTVVW